MVEPLVVPEVVLLVVEPVVVPVVVIPVVEPEVVPEVVPVVVPVVVPDVVVPSIPVVVPVVLPEVEVPDVVLISVPVEGEVPVSVDMFRLHELKDRPVDSASTAASIATEAKGFFIKRIRLVKRKTCTERRLVVGKRPTSCILIVGNKVALLYAPLSRMIHFYS